MAQMTKAQLVDENIRLRHNIAVLERKLHDLSDRCEHLDAQLTRADDAAAERLGRSAQRSVQRAPVRTFRNADGVLMGKFPIGHNRFAIRPVEAA